MMRCSTVQCNLKVLDRSTSSVAPRSLPLPSPMNTGLSNTINSLSTRLRKSWQNERYGNLLQRTITFRNIIANYVYTWSNCTLISSSSEEENWFAIPILFSLQAAKSQLRQNETRERYLFPLPQLSQLRMREKKHIYDMTSSHKQMLVYRKKSGWGCTIFWVKLVRFQHLG